ncbi:hypothetical protein [Phaeovulum veldkampii]|nr:hypothetical protein [Phaeovulum veldkampii]
MNKFATIALALSLTAGTAFAGGYEAPVVEAEPVVVEGNSSSDAGILVPLLLLVGIAAVASN